MSSEETMELLRDTCARILAVPPESVTPDAELREDLGADSLDFAELSMALEDALGRPVEAAEFRGVTTVGDAAELLRTRTAAPERA